MPTSTSLSGLLIHHCQPENPGLVRTRVAVKGSQLLAGWSMMSELTWQESSVHRGVWTKLSDPQGPSFQTRRILTCTHTHTLGREGREREKCRKGGTVKLSHHFCWAPGQDGGCQSQGDRSSCCRLSQWVSAL